MFKHKGKKKYIAAVLTAALVISPVISFSSSAAETANPAESTLSADPNLIHQASERQTITKGVTLENIIRFTTNGWYNINVMRVDLTNKYISLDSLTNTDSIGKLASTKTLANQRNAVAAVNASFFTSDGGSLGHPVGTVVQSSDILCASNDDNKYNNVIASFSITNMNEVIMKYWKADLSLSAQSGVKVPIAQYNKLNGSKFTDITVFDRNWGTRAATSKLPDVLQMVVKNGIVSQMLINQPAAEIPADGYVVVAREAGSKTLQQNFAVGDGITLNIGTNPGWTDMKMSVSGSSMLVKDGVIPGTFSFTPYDVVKNSPKTAIGITKDGKTLLMVTVDGRQSASVGFTLKEMAQYMLSLGAYNAISMDGGGSTTMVARPAGTSELSVINKPSDGISRGVSTAVGVFTSAPASDLAGMIVETSDRYMFNNTSRAFTVKGYDLYNNPEAVDLKSVKWSVSGVRGIFKDNVFYPSSFGEGKITAKVGKVTASIDISVLSTPARIILSSESVKLPVGYTKTFSITGVNSRGYRASIDPKDVKWSVSSKIGSFNNGILTAENRGSGYITATVDKVNAYCALSISSDSTTLKDNFETANGSFSSYPENVEGAYSISDEQKVSGETSGKLNYNFMNSDKTRAVYMVLGKEGMVLDEGVSRISLQVYNDHENSGWLRAELRDAKGNRQVVDLARTMDWTGWKSIEASLENIETPAKLTRIYVAQVNPVEDSGSIYFDDLTATVSGYPSVDLTKIPKDTVPVDEANKAVSFSKATSDSFRFGVLGQSRAPQNTLEKGLVKVFADKITKYLELGAVVGDGSHESITSLVKKKPVIATHSLDLKSTKDIDYKYSVKDFKNSRFIKLDTRNKGLRLSDSAQWKQFLNDLNSFKGKNVFIFMEKSPETFIDKLELALFKETLSKYRLNTLRNVWVFYNGDKNESYMEKGVKYISTAGYEVPGLSKGKTADAQYVLVTVKGSAVTYIYRSIE